MSTVTYNKRDIEKILRNNGWVYHHCSGGHTIYKNKKGEHVSIAYCKCNKMVMQRLIKQYNLKVPKR